MTTPTMQLPTVDAWNKCVEASMQQALQRRERFTVAGRVHDPSIKNDAAEHYYERNWAWKKWAKDQGFEDFPGMKESSTLSYYCGSGSEFINGWLRGGPSPFKDVAYWNEKTRAYVAEIDAVLGRNTLRNTIAATRQVHSNAIDYWLGGPGRDPQDLVGQVFVDRGYTSLSAGGVFRISEHERQYRIHYTVPSGTHSIFMDPDYTTYAEERELLCARGSRTVFTKAWQDPDGIWEFEAILLPPEAV